MRGFNVTGEWIEYNGERFAKVTDERVLRACQHDLEFSISPDEYECPDCEANSHLTHDDNDLEHAKEEGKEEEFQRSEEIIEKLAADGKITKKSAKIIIDALCC